MLLSHDEINHLLDVGVVQNHKPWAVNAASMDIHLGRYIMVEKKPEMPCVSYRERTPLTMERVDLVELQTFVLYPGEFILAQSVEVFNLPLDVSAEYKLKSSMARIGLEHMNAGWADAGWHGSVLTLEFKNMTQHHAIELTYGDAIGQMIFFHHTPVLHDQSYAARGRYNNNTQVSGIRE